MTASLDNSNVAKMGSIQDAVNVAVIALRDLINLLMRSQTKKSMSQNGKRKIEKKDLSKVVLGMKETWTKQEKCHLKRPGNILIRSTVERKPQIDLCNGIKKIPRREEYMTEQCMLLKQGNLLDPINVLDVGKNVLLMLITKTILNLLKSFGFVLHVISTIIIDQNITLREQARKLRKKMRCSDPKRKPWEILRNEVSAYLNRFTSNRIKWQAGGKARFIYLPPGYNNDPFLKCIKHEADLKSSLIILNTPPGYAEGNKVQASERIAA